MIGVWLGPRLLPEDYYPTRHQNGLAEEKAAKDTNNSRFFPDDTFWDEHPEYGYRRLPMFDTGSQSIYVESQPKYIIRRPNTLRQGGTPLVAFWDKKVGDECQGIFEDLAKVFRAY